MRYKPSRSPLSQMCIRDRHYPGDDRHLDPPLADAVEKIIENAVIKEHLRYEELAAGIHLLLEVLDIVDLSARLGMALGIAGSADAEVALGLDVTDELLSLIHISCPAL